MEKQVPQAVVETTRKKNRGWYRRSLDMELTNGIE
jgi:hypothetical protein